MNVNFTSVKFSFFSIPSVKEIFLNRGKLFVILFLLNAISTIAAAQTKLITGTIRDEKGETLPGVTVTLQGSSTAVSSDMNGNFSINIPDGKGVLIFHFVGFADQELTVKGKDKLQVQLKTGSKSLDEVIVVGYGTQKRSSVTAAVSTIKGKDLASQPVANITDALGGHVAGVLFTQSSGEPGKDGADIQIRGVSTTGNSQPLVIVDGVPRNYTQIDPNSIESVSVLKDAAAVAPYGLAGANGVLLITTKKGKSGKPTLSYNSYYGWQNPTVLTKFVNAYQYATLFNAADDNAHPAAPHAYSADDLQKFKDHSDPNGHPDHDVLSELITRNAPMSSNNLQLSGGSDNVRYYTGIGYLSQDGLWGPTNYKRYNLTANIEADATKTTKVSVSINGRVEDGRYPGISSGSIFYQAFRTPPIAPLTFTNGLPGSYISRSAYGNIHGSGYADSLGHTVLSQLSIEQQLPFIKGLSIKGVVSYDYNPFNASKPGDQSAPITSFSRVWLTPINYYSYDPTTKAITLAGNDGPSNPQYYESFAESQAFTYQGYLNYHNTFGKSDVTGLVVLESRNTKASVFSAGRINYNIPIPELNNGSSNSTDISNGGYSFESKQLSAVYRATYAYDNKYLFEASGRYDGNYYFAPGHRFVFFPSFAAGWRLSEEPFIKDNFSWINNLKVRGSWGVSGQLAGGPFQYLSSYQLYGNSAVLNYGGTQGLSENPQANPFITWEQAKKTDVGIEGTLWNGALTFEADYFYEKRTNMLVPPTVTAPGEYGIALAQTNGGAMNNRGIELTLGTTHRFNKDLSVSLSGNITYAHNKLLQVYETSATYDNPNRRITGRPLGTRFGFQSVGFFTPDDFDASGNLKPGIASQPWGQVYPGDIRYKDVNGDGKIDNNDIVPIGKSYNPEIVYGISPSVNYKGFDLSLLFQGAANRDFYDGVYPFDNSASATIDALNYWTPSNPNAANPRITTQPTANNTQTSSFWIRNGSYLRLKTADIGYSLPASVMHALHMQSIRFYIAGQNLLTWSPIKNFDPEVSSSTGQYYPQIKVVTVGVNVTF